MKKKRFMRLVMSYGVQRNEAVKIAAGVSAFGSYEALYAAIRQGLAVRSMGQAFRRFGRSVCKAARAVLDGLAVAFGGIDLAEGEDQSVVVHHAQRGRASVPMAQGMTKGEHAAAHAAGRRG